MAVWTWLTGNSTTDDFKSIWFPQASYGAVHQQDTIMVPPLEPMNVDSSACRRYPGDVQDKNGMTQPSLGSPKLYDHNDDDDGGTTSLPIHQHHLPAATSSSGKLGVIPLAVMIFYSVSGGPFGCEAAVRAAGNFYTLLGFLVMPCVWSIQEALITAELGAALPEAAGGVAWIEEAFGVLPGFLGGWMGWWAGATDNAIYPVLFLDYLLQVVQGSSSDDSDDNSPALNPYVRFLCLAGTSVVLAYVNWLGLPLVGNMSVGICLLAMSPFVVLTVVGAFKVDPSRWFMGPTESIDVLVNATDDDSDAGLLPSLMVGGVLWRPFLNNLFWNLNSFDAAASFAGEIDEPGTVLPRALGWSVLMVTSCYFVPLLVALGASNAAQHEWMDGYLARVAADVVGPWLGDWTVLAAGISNIALFHAELSADAFQLLGMADRGHLPSLFAVRSRHGTPTTGILVGTAVIVVMGVSNLDALIEMLNFNYAVSLLLEYCAFIKLRMARPDLPRPYRIPLGTVGCCVLFAPTYVFTILILLMATWRTYLFCAATNMIGMLVYFIKQQQSVYCQSLYAKKYAAVNVMAVDDVHDVDAVVRREHDGLFHDSSTVTTLACDTDSEHTFA